MSIFSKKKRKTKNLYEFTDEDRRRSDQAKTQKAELRRLEFEKEKIMLEMEVEASKLQLEQARAELLRARQESVPSSDDDTSGIEKMMMGYIGQMMAAKMTNPQQAPIQQPQQQPQSQYIELTDEQIEEYLSTIDKKYLKMAAKMPEENLISVIKQKIPNVSPDSIQRILTKIHP